MAATQADKATGFRTLHDTNRIFVMPNPWDIASARALAGMGFAALATSSGASAAAIGRRDGEMSRDDVLAHARAIVAATDLPVAGDLENGFGDSLEHVAQTIRMAAAAGLVGGSIEDFTGDKAKPFYDAAFAADRVAAAAAAAKSLPFAFTLTARSENYLRGNPDLKDTIARLQAFEKAGADVLFAPGLPDLKSVRAVCESVSKPVSFMIGIKGSAFSVAELEAAGVRRVSLGGTLYRAAMVAFMNASREIKEQGTFGFVDRF